MKQTLIMLFGLLLNLASYGQKFDNLALTPPMGWNSWNKFNCDINEQIIRETADALVSTGMKDAGYEYVIIDDCWQIDRDSLGFIVADPERFPSGIKALADYVHSKGLKFGLYTCAGRKTCQERPGSRGHEFQDALTYARWGVDFVKADWCNSEGQHAVESYALLRDALYQAGRPMVFSLCEWGLNKPWEWAADVGHMWRTTGDIRDNWDIPDAKEGKCWAGGVIINLDMQQGLEEFAGPGHWNDPDMLQVGNGDLTEIENRAHFSLWCMLAAPLFSGNDIRQMPASVVRILLNREVIAIDQDSLGKQGFKIKDYGQIELYYKPLKNGETAICVFNRYNYPVKIELNWQTLSITAWRNNQKVELPVTIDRKEFRIENRYQIRDLWGMKVLGTTELPTTAEIEGHDVLMLKLYNSIDQ
jgi:alpha-galactosidase